MSGDRGYPPGGRRPEHPPQETRALGEQVAEMRADMRHVVGMLDQYRQLTTEIGRSVNETRGELGRKLDDVIKPLATELREQGSEINALKDRITKLETTVGYLKLVVFGFVGVVLMGFAGALLSIAQVKPGVVP